MKNIYKTPDLRFYDALPGTTWLVNATKYGHGDVLDEFYYDAMEVNCHKKKGGKDNHLK